MDNLDLLFSLTDYEWALYSIHRINQSQFQLDYLKQELIRQILLELDFRTTINEVIDNEIIDNQITIDNELIDISDIMNFINDY